MANVCIICFKFEERNDKSQNNVELQRKYFKFVERYVSGVGGGGDDGSGYQLTNFLFEQALNSGMVCCGKCHERMEAFCDLYNQLKIIELRLNWEVERLKSNLEFGGELGSLKNLNVDGNYWVSEDEMLELIKDLRRSIVEKCNRKLSRSLPKVAVSEYGLENYFTGSPPTTTDAVDQPQPEVNANEDDQVLDEMDYEEVASSACSEPGKEDENEKILESTDVNPIIKVEINRANEKTTSDLIDIDVDPNPSLGEPEMPHDLSNHEENPFSSIFDNVAKTNLMGNSVDLPDIPPSSTDSDSEYSDFLNTSDPESDEGEVQQMDQDQPDLKPVIKKEPSQSKIKSSRFKQYRFKCPGCSNLYKHLHELLRHHNNNHKSSVKETLRVDIFWISRQMLPWKYDRLPVFNSATIPPHALHHCATFKTPTKVFFCSNKTCKDQPIYSEEALNDHAKLHGKFKCNFCSITKDFAPDLSLHEITKHVKDKTKGFRCSRCDYRNLFCKEGVINHHLTVHSSLPSFYTQGHCAVCKVNSNSFRPPYTLIEHCIKLHSTIISKIERRKTENMKEKKERKGKYFIFKCPTCPNLYRHLYELLLHHKEDHHSQTQETLRLDICWIFYKLLPFFKPNEFPSVSTSEKFPAADIHHDATIEVPTKVYFCNDKSCKEQPIYTEHALQEHTKLHGEFNCNFCSVTKEFAPDLVLHEIAEHGKDKSGKRHNCPRCDYSNKCQWQGESVVNHYLAEHLSLPPFFTQGFCAICNVRGINSQYKSSAVLFKHYRNQHNHKGTGKRKARFPCSICNQIFNSSNQRQIHRHQKHSGDSRRTPLNPKMRPLPPLIPLNLNKCNRNVLEQNVSNSTTTGDGPPNEDNPVSNQINYEDAAFSVYSEPDGLESDMNIDLETAPEVRDENDKSAVPVNMNSLPKEEINRANEKISDTIGVGAKPLFGELHHEMQQQDMHNHEKNPSSSIFDNVAKTNLKGNSVDIPALSEDIPPRRLRKVNKCDKCSRTFSALEKLLDHQKECHHDIAQEITDESSDEHESLLETSDFLDYSDQEGDSINEDVSEVDANELDQDKQDMKPIIKMETNQSLPLKEYKLKCPGCPNLYKHLHELLLHHNNSHKNSNEVNGTLRVDIFWIARQMLAPKYKNLSVLNSADLPPNALHHSATIETPTQIYFCKYSSCKEQPIYSEEALNDHAKLHGEFKCKFCSVTEKFAPDISLHEISQHKHKNTKAFCCSRCDYKNTYCKEFIINHHLTVHSSLPPFYTQGNCPICKVSNNSFRTSYALIDHCRKNHKSNPTEIAEGKIFIFKCPSCPNLYKYLHELFHHHKEDHNNNSEVSESLLLDVYWIPNQLLQLKPTLTVLNSNDFPAEAVNHHATIPILVESSTKTYFCKSESCKKHPIYSDKDLQEHVKLHGEFKCNFCLESKKFAPDLALHEIIDHGKYIPGKGHHCPLCDYSQLRRQLVVNHHITTHLSLAWKGRHHCRRCPKTFRNVEDLYLHSKEHDDDNEKVGDDSLKPPKTRNSLKCPDCKELFLHIRDLLLHHQNRHRKTESNLIIVDIFTYPSHEMPQTLEDSEIEATHRIEVPRGIFICPMQFCRKPFYSKDGLEQHKKLHGKFKCNFCKQMITSAVKLAYHEVNLHGKIGKKRLRVGRKCGKSRECPRCKETFTGEKPYIEHHVGTHLSLTIDDHDCPICKVSNYKKGYFAKPGMRKYQLDHLKSNHDIKGLSQEEIQRCHVADCGAYFTEGYQLSNHLQLKHNFDEKEKKEVKKKGYKCVVCGKELSATDSLQMHLRNLHKHDPKLFRCTQDKDCPNLFGTQKELDRHIRNKHAVGMKYFAKVNCPTCHQLVNKHSLSSHMRIHKNEGSKETRPFVCEECGKGFKNNGRLQQHNLTHAGPESWPFTCEICGKKSRHKTRHEEHLRTHSKQKPFVCQVCGVSYAHRHNLRIHVNNKHSDVMQDIPKKMDLTNINRKAKDGIYHVNKQRKIVTETDSDSE